MAQYCAVVCLMLGLAGLILFAVGFALPYWFVDPKAGGTSHGLWEKKECQRGSCTETRIAFGVTAAFESCRVFSCATTIMALISVIFNLILVSRGTKAWAIRTTAVWISTVFFNALVVVLFGVTEKETLEALALAGVDISAKIITRFDWGYWVTAGSLAVFVLIALSCASLACSMQMTAKKEPTIDEDQHPTTINLHHPGTQTNTGDNLSLVTTKTAEIFPPPATQTAVRPPVHYGTAAVSNGYVIQPTRAAVNIDNHRIRLNALDAPHHVTGQTQAEHDIRKDNDRFVLNRPVYSPGTTDNSGYGTEIPFQQLSYGGQNGIYSINISRNGFPKQDSSRPFDATARSAVGQVGTSQTNEGPPAYTTLPRDDGQPITVIPISSKPSFPAYNASNQLYPNLL